MGSRTWKVALVVIATMAAAAACAPAPKPPPPLRVTTTAETFDGVCDEVDCSFADAVHASNQRPLNAGGIPNEIRVPAGTYTFTGATPLVITDPVVINGAGRTATILDLSGSPITAPGAVLDPQNTTVMTGMRIVSDAASPTHVLASCAGHLPKSFSLLNSAAENLAGVSTACDAVFVGVDVNGPTSVITPNSISATGSRLPFPDEPLVVARFSFVNSVIVGPTAADGSSVDSTLTIHPKPGININGTFTGSHFDRVGLSLGDPAGGNVFAVASLSSFDLAGDDGPRGIDVLPGSSLRLTQSSVFGGGPAGAIQADGQLILQGATIANPGPGIVVGTGANVTARRSILSTLGAGPVCTAPITLTAYNVHVDSSCGTPSATDLTVASHAELQLSDVGANASRNPSLSMVPAQTSPVVDKIAKQSISGLDCPFSPQQNMGASMDQRGYARPSGEACDLGAAEYLYPVVPPATTTTSSTIAP
jgi:hypothetical protein